MTINHTDGQFALDMWFDPEVVKEADDTEFGDNIDDLRTRAATILAAGRFKALELFRWNPMTQDWDSIEEFY